MVSPIGNQQATYNYTQRILKQSNPSLDGYWVNTINFGPMTAPTLQHTTQTTSTTTQTATDSGCTDGKDDGSIGFFSAVGHALKGGVKFFTGMFTDENGDFSLKQTAKTLLLGGAIAAATFIPVVGPLVIPALCTVGMIDGGCKVIKGMTTAMDAKTDAEAKEAWEQIGNGATEGIVSYTGYKASGGWKSNIAKAKTQYNTKFGDLSKGKAATAEPTAETPAAETSTTDKPADTTAETSTETETSTTKKTTKKTHKKSTKTKTKKSTLERNKAKEPQVRKSQPLAEEARRNSLNEQAAKVDRGESTAHTNAEIRQTADNIDTSRLNGNDRAMVERAAKDVPTEAQQAKYDREMAYQAADPKDVAAAKEKGVRFVEQEGPNATQNLGEVEVQSSNPEVKNLGDLKTQMEQAEAAPKTNANGMTDAQIKAQIADTGRIPDGDYLVEMQNGESGIYRVKDGKLEIVEKAGKEFTGKNIERKEAAHLADVETQIKEGNFVAA